LLFILEVNSIFQYGPMQASRSWSIRFDKTIKQFGFEKTWTNQVYTKGVKIK